MLFGVQFVMFLSDFTRHNLTHELTHTDTHRNLSVCMVKGCD